MRRYKNNLIIALTINSVYILCLVAVGCVDGLKMRSVPRGLYSEPVDLEQQLMRVYEKAGPSVVNINTSSIGFAYFSKTVPQGGSGSGFVYDDLGHIITNHHVVDDAIYIQVTFHDQSVSDAFVVGSDASNDLAVLLVTDFPDSAVPITFAKDDSLDVGRLVVAIGNPFGIGESMTFGVISALRRVIFGGEITYTGEMVQTDTAINPGNSGGPLLDMEGNLVGVTTALMSPVRGSTGVGFAIPSQTVRKVAPDLIVYGEYKRPWLGVQLYALNPALANRAKEDGADVPENGGLAIVKIVPGSPAAKSGLKPNTSSMLIGHYEVPTGGDIITAIDGRSVNSYKDLVNLVETKLKIGQKIAMTIYRDGKEVQVQLTIGQKKAK